MTEQDLLLLQTGGTPTPSRIDNPAIKNSFTPAGVNSFNESVPRSPLPQEFNNIPLSEIEFASSFRGMDTLHQADSLATEFNRGAALKELKKNVGDEAFKNIYKTLKNPTK